MAVCNRCGEEMSVSTGCVRRLGALAYGREPHVPSYAPRCRDCGGADRMLPPPALLCRNYVRCACPAGVRMLVRGDAASRSA